MKQGGRPRRSEEQPDSAFGEALKEHLRRVKDFTQTELARESLVAEKTLSEMVKAIGARWRIEEDFENAKDLGMDHYEVRSFIGWYRHVTLVLVAHAFLAGICAAARSSASPPAPGSPPLTRPPVLPLTVPEVRHLLARLIWPSPSGVKRVLAWSWWRRCHRSSASYFHTKRRLEAG